MGSLDKLVVTCQGHYNDPDLHHRLHWLIKQLSTLADTDTLTVHKVEPWNSIKVTFNIPRHAATHLRSLAQNGDPSLRNLGILSVQLENGNVIDLNTGPPPPPPPPAPVAQPQQQQQQQQQQQHVQQAQQAQTQQQQQQQQIPHQQQHQHQQQQQIPQPQQFQHHQLQQQQQQQQMAQAQMNQNAGFPSVLGQNQGMGMNMNASNQALASRMGMTPSPVPMVMHGNSVAPPSQSPVPQGINRGFSHGTNQFQQRGGFPPRPSTPTAQSMSPSPMSSMASLAQGHSVPPNTHLTPSTMMQDSNQQGNVFPWGLTGFPQRGQQQQQQQQQWNQMPFQPQQSPQQEHQQQHLPFTMHQGMSLGMDMAANQTLPNSMGNTLQTGIPSRPPPLPPPAEVKKPAPKKKRKSKKKQNQPQIPLPPPLMPPDPRTMNNPLPPPPSQDPLQQTKPPNLALPPSLMNNPLSPDAPSVQPRVMQPALPSSAMPISTSSGAVPVSLPFSQSQVTTAMSTFPFSDTSASRLLTPQGIAVQQSQTGQAQSGQSDMLLSQSQQIQVTLSHEQHPQVTTGQSASTQQNFMPGHHLSLGHHSKKSATASLTSPLLVNLLQSDITATQFSFSSEEIVKSTCASAVTTGGAATTRNEHTIQQLQQHLQQQHAQQQMQQQQLQQQVHHQLQQQQQQQQLHQIQNQHPQLQNLNPQQQQQLQQLFSNSGQPQATSVPGHPPFPQQTLSNHPSQSVAPYSMSYPQPIFSTPPIQMGSAGPPSSSSLPVTTSAEKITLSTTAGFPVSLPNQIGPGLPSYPPTRPELRGIPRGPSPRMSVPVPSLHFDPSKTQSSHAPPSVAAMISARSQSTSPPRQHTPAVGSRMVSGFLPPSIATSSIALDVPKTTAFQQTMSTTSSGSTLSAASASVPLSTASHVQTTASGNMLSSVHKPVKESDKPTSSGDKIEEDHSFDEESAMASMTEAERDTFAMAARIVQEVKEEKEKSKQVTPPSKTTPSQKKKHKAAVTSRHSHLLSQASGIASPMSPNPPAPPPPPSTRELLGNISHPISGGQVHKGDAHSNFPNIPFSRGFLGGSGFPPGGAPPTSSSSSQGFVHRFGGSQRSGISLPTPRMAAPPVVTSVQQFTGQNVAAAPGSSLHTSGNVTNPVVGQESDLNVSQPSVGRSLPWPATTTPLTTTDGIQTIDRMVDLNRQMGFGSMSVADQVLGAQLPQVARTEQHPFPPGNQMYTSQNIPHPTMAGPSTTANTLPTTHTQGVVPSNAPLNWPLGLPAATSTSVASEGLRFMEKLANNPRESQSVRTGSNSSPVYGAQSSELSGGEKKDDKSHLKALLSEINVTPQVPVHLPASAAVQQPVANVTTQSSVMEQNIQPVLPQVGVPSQSPMLSQKQTEAQPLKEVRSEVKQLLQEDLMMTIASTTATTAPTSTNTTGNDVEESSSKKASASGDAVVKKEGTEHFPKQDEMPILKPYGGLSRHIPDTVQMPKLAGTGTTAATPDSNQAITPGITQTVSLPNVPPTVLGSGPQHPSVPSQQMRRTPPATIALTPTDSLHISTVEPQKVQQQDLHPVPGVSPTNQSGLPAMPIMSQSQMGEPAVDHLPKVQSAEAKSPGAAAERSLRRQRSISPQSERAFSSASALLSSIAKSASGRTVSGSTDKLSSSGSSVGSGGGKQSPVISEPLSISPSPTQAPPVSSPMPILQPQLAEALGSIPDSADLTKLATSAIRGLSPPRIHEEEIKPPPQHTLDFPALKQRRRRSSSGRSLTPPRSGTPPASYRQGMMGSSTMMRGGTPPAQTDRRHSPTVLGEVMGGPSHGMRSLMPIPQRMMSPVSEYGPYGGHMMKNIHQHHAFQEQFAGQMHGSSNLPPGLMELQGQHPMPPHFVGGGVPGNIQHPSHPVTTSPQQGQAGTHQFAQNLTETTTLTHAPTPNVTTQGMMQSHAGAVHQTFARGPAGSPRAGQFDPSSISAASTHTSQQLPGNIDSGAMQLQGRNEVLASVMGQKQSNLQQDWPQKSDPSGSLGRGLQGHMLHSAVSSASQVQLPRTLAEAKPIVPTTQSSVKKSDQLGQAQNDPVATMSLEPSSTQSSSFAPQSTISETVTKPAQDIAPALKTLESTGSHSSALPADPALSSKPKESQQIPPAVGQDITTVYPAGAPPPPPSQASGILSSTTTVLDAINKAQVTPELFTPATLATTTTTTLPQETTLTSAPSSEPANLPVPPVLQSDGPPTPVHMELEKDQAAAANASKSEEEPTLPVLTREMSDPSSSAEKESSLAKQPDSMQGSSTPEIPTLSSESKEKVILQETSAKTISDLPKPSPESSVATEKAEEIAKVPEAPPSLPQARDATPSTEGLVMKEVSLPDQEDTDSTSSRSETPKSHLSEPPAMEDTSPSIRTRRSGRKSPGAATTPGLEGGPMGTRTRSSSGSLASTSSADKDGDGTSDQDGVTTRKRSMRHNAKAEMYYGPIPAYKRRKTNQK